MIGYFFVLGFKLRGEDYKLKAGDKFALNSVTSPALHLSREVEQLLFFQTSSGEDINIVVEGDPPVDWLCLSTAVWDTIAALVSLLTGFAVHQIANESDGRKTFELRER